MEKDSRKNVIQDKSFAFAVRIVACRRNLQREQKEFVLSFDGLVSECREVLTILNSIIFTTRSRVRSEPPSTSPNIQNSDLHRAKRGLP